MADVQLAQESLSRAVRPASSRPGRVSKMAMMLSATDACGKPRVPGAGSPSQLGSPVHGQAADILVVQKNLAMLAAGEAHDHVKAVVLPAPLGPNNPTTSPLSIQGTNRAAPAVIVAFGEFQRPQHAHGLDLGGGGFLAAAA